MYSFLVTILIGISLSMDAFSLSLIYGTLICHKKDKIVLSLIVGVYHFIMPLMGAFFGGLIIKYLIIDLDILVAIIFLIIGIEMVISCGKNSGDNYLVSFGAFLIFGLSVSIDSLTTGFGLKAINNNYLEVALIFALISGVFTYLGLKLGCKLSEKYGKYATLCGGVMLFILGILYYL